MIGMGIEQNARLIVKQQRQFETYMRLTKTGWMTAVTMGGLLALQPLAQAQDKKDDKPAAPPASPAAPAAPAVTPGAPLTGPDMRARRAEAQLNGMTPMYSLTDEQKTKIKPILEDQFKQMEELQKEKTLTSEDRRKKMMEIRDGSQAKIKALLTPEQVQKMDTMRQRGPRPLGGAPGAPATPPPAAPPK